MKRRLNLSVGHAGISSANMATMSMSRSEGGAMEPTWTSGGVGLTNTKKQGG